MEKSCEVILYDVDYYLLYGELRQVKVIMVLIFTEVTPSPIGYNLTIKG